MAVGEVLAPISVGPLPEVEAVDLAWGQVPDLPDEPVEAGEDSVERLASEVAQMPVPDAPLDLVEAFGAYNRRLGRMAYMVLGNAAEADDVVAEVFAKLIEHNGVRDPEKLVAYLRQSVMNGATSVLRHRLVEEKKRAILYSGAPWDSTTEGVLQGIEREEVRALISRLPRRQREAIVFRYYDDLSEAQIAEVMGISRGAVKSHTARGMVALRGALYHVVPEVD